MSKLISGRFLLLMLLLMLLLLITPVAVWAESDIKITVTDPTRQGGVFYEGATVNEGTTVNTVLSSPQVSHGENKVLGTLRITGKKGIAEPVQQGNRVMV